jgi:hypothetical protein
VGLDPSPVWGTYETSEPMTQENPIRRFRPGTTLAGSLLLTLATTTCETGWTANIGVSAGPQNDIVASVYACEADQRIELSLQTDPDTMADTGDEELLWRISGTVDAPGMFRAVIGETPPSFREEVKLRAPLRPSTEYALSLSWDRLDMGIIFTPSELPPAGIRSGGVDLSEQDFQDGAQDSCGN